ncbi:tail fiber/spike domain-containing protein [Pseudocitrobacter faecalis]|uniref:tail fiber/spike domain-containing protein n=1 Tax=Pseudocitrobacter faecalis TaxID=1398493 RepID=UPI003314D035
MTTQPTNLPVPSESPRDLKFNAGKIDEFVTSFESKYVDRFGGEHYTIEGLRWLIQQAISSMGWVLIDSFQDGADITLPNQALRDEVSGEYYRWDGPLPKHVDAGSTPASSGGVGVGVGAWVGIGDASLRAYLATVAGAASIGLQPGGNLQQAITWVTPEQFGAIGDGTVHPLSERYATLAAAQAVYPFVTSLTQTIDWAACQAAENYARGKEEVRCPSYAQYHFGDNGLQLGENSKWKGNANVQYDKPATTMIRNFPSSTPVFGQCYIVRVMPAPSGAADVFQRGVVFDGFKLRYPVARRTPTKGTNTICLHGGNGIQGVYDLSLQGSEYGLYAWSFWGNRGRIRVDSCHKGYFVVPTLSDPERAGGGTTTSNQFDIRVDVTPFPITIGSDYYSQYTGYFKGVVTTDQNYDSNNETASGITIIGPSEGGSFIMGIEKFQGVHVVQSGGNVNLKTSFSFFPDDHYKMSTGNDGADSAIRAISGTSSSRIQLPPSQRSYLNNISGNLSLIVENTGYYMGNIGTETSSTRYLCNIQSSGSIYSFIGGYVGFTPETGMAPVSFSPSESMKSRVTTEGCRSMDIWCAPSTSWSLIGKNRWRRTS